MKEESQPPSQALEMAKKVLKSVPQKDPTDFLKSDLLKNVPNSQSTDAFKSGTQDAQRVGPQAGQNAAAGVSPQKTSFTATLGNEGEWRADKPPSAWPKFPPGDPLNEAPRKRTNGEAISFASGVDERWRTYKAGQTKMPPAASEINEALRALLAVTPDSPEFPSAWELFIRLRKADREANANRPR